MRPLARDSTDQKFFRPDLMSLDRVSLGLSFLNDKEVSYFSFLKVSQEKQNRERESNVSCISDISRKMVSNEAQNW